MLPTWPKWIVWITLFCSTVWVLQYIPLLQLNVHQKFIKIFYPAIKHIKYNLNDSINLGFSRFEHKQAKLQEEELQRDYDLTAILLHWKRMDGVTKTLKHFINTGLFKQIIIWNNNPQINLTVHHLIQSSDSSKFIRIINSKINLKDEAKYLACVEATTRACFYVDDDYDATPYIKSLIASFRSDPNVLHIATDTITFYLNLFWSYFDPTIDLHTGFSWIGCGSVFLREHAQRHLQFLHKFLKNDTHLIHYGDIFFSIWLNDIPSQMTTNLRQLPSTSLKGSVAFSSTPNFFKIEAMSSGLAIRTLERSLRLNRTNESDNIMFPRQQNRRFPYCVKSPSLNDDFIFYSNILPYQLQNISFNISRDFERANRKIQAQDSNVKYFLSHSTVKVVDGDLSTCWHANRFIEPDDFFAVDFLYIQTNLIFTLAVAHSPLLQSNLDIRISFDGLRWMSYRSRKGIFTKQNRISEQHLHTFLFDTARFNQGFESLRYISFQANDRFDHRLQVCEIQMVSTKNIDGIMRDFLPLEM